jgi:hypothetical protein
MTYDAWMKAIDALLIKEICISQEDLPDWLSKDAYNSGLSPREGMSELLSSLFDYVGEKVHDEL